MGKKTWFSAVKKVVSSSYLKKKRSPKSKSSPKKSCLGIQMSLDACLSPTKAPLANPLVQETDLTQPEYEKIEQTQTQTQTSSIDDVTAITEEIEDTTSVDDAEVNCETSSEHFQDESEVETAATKIQTAFRGYVARKDMRPLKARRRLRVLTRSPAVKRQTTSALWRMQSAARVQSQVQSRTLKMYEMNVALQRQLRQRREKELANKKSFDLSPRSKEQVEASLKQKKDAEERREKAIAFSLSRQQTWRKSLKSEKSTPNYPEWGWSWSERWNAVRPWSTATTNNKETVQVVAKPVSRPPTKARSNPGPSPLGLAKKQLLSSNSTSSKSTRTSKPLKTNSKTVRRTRSI